MVGADATGAVAAPSRMHSDDEPAALPGISLKLEAQRGNQIRILEEMPPAVDGLANTHTHTELQQTG